MSGIFRTPTNVQKMIKSRATSSFRTYTLPPNYNDKLIPAKDRHSLRIKNLSGLAVEGVVIPDLPQGADINWSVPTGDRYELVGIRFIFETSIAAGTRNVMLYINDDAGNEIFRTGYNVNHAPSTLIYYQALAAGGVAGSVHPNVVLAPLPPRLILKEWYSIVTETTGLDVSDIFYDIRLMVKKYVDLRLNVGEPVNTQKNQYVSLLGGEEKYFSIHYSGLLPYQSRDVSAWQQIFHCEADDDIYIHNPSSTSNCPIEVIEVM